MRSRHASPTVYGGAGGRGTRISSTVQSSSMDKLKTWGSQSYLMKSNTFTIGNEKEKMQHLNDRLASYLETVRNLEQANNKLELQIREYLDKRGPDVNDYSQYDNILGDLHKQIVERILDKANLAVKIDNLNLAVDNFWIKLETESWFRKTFKANIVGYRNELDNTNMIRMKLESDIEAQKEELVLLKMNHEQNLVQVMEDIRAKYEKMALKNQRVLKEWYILKISAVDKEVTEDTAALHVAITERNGRHRLVRSLEIDIQSQRSQNASLEDTLQDMQLHHNMEMQEQNVIILQLESKLTQLRVNIQRQTQEYQMLLNIKMKLEAEIITYRRLLEGEEFNETTHFSSTSISRLEEVMEAKPVQTQKTITVTQTMVNGKVVSEVTNVKEQ
ncbi:hypothetical protein AAFF_G00242360 [Aldrovandia affinis]|uniref:IF rod domain-containing protein n=1 Tax=Aldrovandia affinis TaxID=143900 RepID=A0AAD7WU92_9TELE|nr:hypothetical protein AAFF_G00242360 [Aldrovandia affinis]